MNSRKVGGMGHSDFEKLCSMAGLVCNNSSREDATGWDTIVEFPLVPHLNILNDIQSQAIQCFVQIKSTDRKTKSVRVKLSNLKRFCDSSLPCFFFFAEYENGWNPVAIYLVHFDRDLMFDVLKKIREVEAGNKMDFNRVFMSVKYNDKNRIADIDGNALKRNIEHYVPDGMINYTRDKFINLESLGYEDKKCEVQFKLASETDYHSLIKASLGYDSSINVKQVKGWDTRFGINIEMNEMSNSSGVMKIISVEPYSKGTISFEDKEDFISFDCDFFVSDIAINAPNDLASFRVKCEHFDLLVGLRNGISTVDFAPDSTVMNIFDLRSIIKLMKIFSASAENITITIEKNNKQILFTLNKNAVLNSDVVEEINNLGTISSYLVSIASFFNIEKSCNVSLNDIRRMQRDIDVLYSFVSDLKRDIYLRIEFENIKDELDVLKEFHVFVSVPLNLNGLFICLTAIVHGGFIQDGKVITLTNQKVNIGRYFTGKDKNEIKKKIENVARKVDDTYQGRNGIELYFYNSFLMGC